MLARPRPFRLNPWHAALGLVALPLAVAGAAPAAQASPPAQQPPVVPPPAVAQPAVLRGRVTDKNNAPLPGVRVRVAVPATDMRFVNPTTDHLQFEAQSGADGEYRLEVPGIVEATKVSIDALTPGYRRLVGLVMRMGDAKSVDLEPGKEVEADLALEPALYCRGVVVDEQGRPVAGVKIDALASSARATGGVEVTATGPDGAFEIFNYPVAPVRFQGGDPTKGRLNFDHPEYIAAQVEDIYALDRDGRDHLRVVLPTGRKVAGTVLDAAGKPVADALVKVSLASGMHRKAITTDAAGRFALRGLSPGAAMLDVRALAIKQKLKLPLLLDGDQPDLEVQLQPIALPPDLKTYDVLGMKLADVTPELQAAYDLYHPQGVLILDPGPDAGRLDIGAITEGNEFWMAGQQRIRGLRDFIDRIIAEAGARDAEIYSVRVVYTFVTAESEGTNAQYLKLTRADLAQLKELAGRLKAEAK